jgi:hypothetical protein
MSSLTKSKLTLYLAAIFVAGTVSGGFLGYFLGSERRPMQRPSAEQIVEYVHDKLSDDVGVTAEQWNAIMPIVTNSVREIGDLDSRNREQIHELIERSDAAIMEKLTPEQKPRMRKWIEDRESHRHGGRGKSKAAK